MLGSMSSTDNSGGSTYSFHFIGSTKRMFVNLIKRFLGMPIWACMEMQKKGKSYCVLSLTLYIWDLVVEIHTPKNKNL